MDIISFNEAATANGRIEKFIENPDSNSGVLTQPKVIEAGETVTIKSGRQAILADTVVDGDLVIEAGGDVFIPAGAGFGDLDQRIDTKLYKDFSSFTDKPTPENTDNTVIQESNGTLKKLSWANLKATLLTYFSLGFAVSLTTNGYIKLPNWLGGIIIQWGIISQGTTVSVSFPIAYPTKCASVVCVQSNADNVLATYGVFLISHLGFSSRCSRTDTGATYISIGY